MPPGFAESLGKRLAGHGLLMLDAPVSGGAARAASGEMTMMTSGPADAYALAEDVLAAIAGKVYRLGDAHGAGSKVKIINQLLAGVHIAAERWLPAGQPRAAVVFMHGLGEHRRARPYPPFYEALAAAGYAVLAFDLRGHGESQGPRLYARNLAVLTQDLSHAIALAADEANGRPVFVMGGSLGGAIVKDRVHYFLAFDRQQSSVPLAIADIRTPQDEIDLGIAKDSLDRFLDILTRRYGVSEGAQMVGIFSRRPVANAVFGRLDWQINGSLGERRQPDMRDIGYLADPEGRYRYTAGPASGSRFYSDLDDASYGGGRFLTDNVKGTHGRGVQWLGGDRVRLDFNYLYNPSCAYDQRWACPLAPPENRVTAAIPAGELTYLDH